ncbi:MAG: Imm26 family immunity protein [Saprospiraceae bacterium]|jgi:hypothetical protein
MKKEKLINRKNLRNGDVVCIPIKDLGFAYGKYINVDEIFNIESSYSNFMKFYVGIYPEKISNLDQLSREVLIPPTTVVTHTVVKRLGWEIFLNEEIFEEDKLIPDTKKGWPPFAYYPNELDYEKWLYLHFFSGKSGKEVMGEIDYPKIRHLMYEGILSAELMPIWLIVENNKLNGEELAKGLGILGDNETFILNREKYRPCYAGLDKKTRDFALK